MSLEHECAAATAQMMEARIHGHLLAFWQLKIETCATSFHRSSAYVHGEQMNPERKGDERALLRAVIRLGASELTRTCDANTLEFGVLTTLVG